MPLSNCFCHLEIVCVLNMQIPLSFQSPKQTFPPLGVASVYESACMTYLTKLMSTGFRSALLHEDGKYM